MPLHLRRLLFGRYFRELEQQHAHTLSQLGEARAERDALAQKNAELEKGLDCLRDDVARFTADRDRLASENADLRDAEARLAADNAELTAERDALWIEARRDTYNLAMPPDHLQQRVVGVVVPAFLWSGERIALEMETLVARHGVDLSAAGTMLDFGSGVGRVTRVMAARYPQARHTGADIDAEAVQWCSEHLSGLARFVTIADNPPTPFADGEFGFVYGVSVFTHLPEEMQFQWLAELRRVTAPGGHLLLTTQGDNYYYHVPPEQQEEFRARGFAYVYWQPTPGLPDYYQVAVHTHDYIRREWGRFFDVLDIAPRAISGQQDAVLLRRPAC